MINTPYKYKNRNAKDRNILVGLAELSMPERYKRLQKLESEIQKMEKSLANKRSGSQTEKQRRAVLVDEDGLIELKCRLALERSEYLTRKEITPDFEEPAGAKGRTCVAVRPTLRIRPLAALVLDCVNRPAHTLNIDGAIAPSRRMYARHRQTDTN